MFKDFWSLIFIWGMFVLVILDVVQLLKKLGHPLINILQALSCIGIAIEFAANFGQGSFPFGVFLRITTLFLIASLFFDVFAFLKADKENKWLLMLFLIIKALPLVGIIFQLTQPYMT